MVYSVSRNELIHYRGIFGSELQNILSWWKTYSVEKEGDGFYGAAGLDGRPVPMAKKSCVLNARILWTYAAAAIRYHEKKYAEMADRAYSVLQKYFSDPLYGGYYMEIHPDNTVASSIKHTYAQAFVIYSLSKYYELKSSPDVFRIIQDFFNLLELKTKDPVHAGYFEAFHREWQTLGENRMADHNEPRSMNTHLHVMEAYAALYRIWKDRKVHDRLKELLELFIHRIIRENGHLGIFFDEDFNETVSSKSICSFGHDIEASWLLYEAAGILGDPGIVERTKKLAIRITDAVEREGVDKDGGLFLESSRFGSHVRTHKHWWLQAENLVGFMNAFEITGDKKYWETVKLTWNFIDTCVIDHEYGEWFTKVNRLGIPFREELADDPSPYYRNDWKIDPWKCPYHNGRAMMELTRRIDLILRNFKL